MALEKQHFRQQKKLYWQKNNTEKKNNTFIPKSIYYSNCCWKCLTKWFNHTFSLCIIALDFPNSFIHGCALTSYFWKKFKWLHLHHRCGSPAVLGSRFKFHIFIVTLSVLCNILGWLQQHQELVKHCLPSLIICLSFFAQASDLGDSLAN